MYDPDRIQHAELSKRCTAGARWFYSIAELTLLTSVISLLGGGWPDPRWRDHELNTLKNIKGSQVEVMQMTNVVTP